MILQCIIWKDNRQAFGCNNGNNGPQMDDLCDKPVIRGAGNRWPLIYILRGGKYWIFDNKPLIDNKPLGELLEGSSSVYEKWPGIHIPGGNSYYKTAFIMVYRTKWSLWDNKSGDLFDNLIMNRTGLESDGEEGIGDDTSSGALINVDVRRSRFAKISGHQVCNFHVNNRTAVWIGKCVDVDKDPEMFPPNIIAAIKSKDNHWYYLNKKAFYCKRESGLRHKVRHTIPYHTIQTYRSVSTVAHTLSLNL